MGGLRHLLLGQKPGGVGGGRLVEIWVGTKTEVRKIVQQNPESEGFPNRKGDGRMEYRETRKRKKG